MSDAVTATCAIVLRVVHWFPVLDEAIKHAAECFGAFGVAKFQFKLDDGEVSVIEINESFSDMTPFRTVAGFNEVEGAVRCFKYEASIQQPSIESSVIMRHWSETTVRPSQLGGVPTAGKAI